MSTQIRNGKKPLSQKSRPAPVNAEDIFQNPLGLDPELVTTLQSKGVAYRFINYKKFIEMGGQHQGYWKPVRLSQLKEWGYDNMGLNEFINGQDPDGFVRRQDLVLAIRSKDINDKHLRYLRQEADRVKDMQEAHANEARERVRGSGIKVHSGYEDEFDSESENEA